MSQGSLDLLGNFERAMVTPPRVPICEFAESSDYLGKNLFPAQRVMLKLWFLEELTGPEEDILTKWIQSSADGGEVTICPMIRERVDYLRDNKYPHFQLVQLVGGRRSSKGFMTGIGIAYKVYGLVQMDDPMTWYGIDPDKEIYVPIIAASQKQATDFQYADAYSSIRSCEALRPYWGKGMETELSVHTPADLRKLQRLAQGRETRDMAKIRVAALASSADTIRGSASIVIAMDEVAQMLAGESRRSAGEVYAAAVPSLRQFDLDGLVFANSSPYTKVGLFWDLYEQSFMLEGAFPAFPERFMMQFPSWTMYENDEGRKPLITYSMLKQERKADPDKFRVEYMAQFAETVDAYLRPEMVDRMFTGAAPDGRVLKTEHAGIGIFQYKAHGDPSQTTANFGFAIGHVEIHPTDDGEGNVIDAPHVVFDLIDAFYPGEMKDEVIDWFVVMDVFTELIRNFRPYEWTFDQFDSAQAIQQLRRKVVEMGINDVRVREKTATPAVNQRRWDNFKAALYLGRVHAPAPVGQLNARSLELVKDELKFLQVKNGKVVKQDIGPVTTKDMADCVAEVTDALIGDSLSGTKAALGAQRLQAGEGRRTRENAPGGLRGMSGFREFYEGRPRDSSDDPARSMDRRGRRR